MTYLSKSEQCRGELFRPNERSFATFHHSDFASASSYCKSNFYHINALSNICKITIKIKQVFVFHATKSVKWIFHQLHR